MALDNGKGNKEKCCIKVQHFVRIENSCEVYLTITCKLSVSLSCVSRNLVTNTGHNEQRNEQDVKDSR